MPYFGPGRYRRIRYNLAENLFWALVIVVGFGLLLAALAFPVLALILGGGGLSWLAIRAVRRRRK